ncbi:seipin isoform X1 [Neodiprion pinetum]|uniref:seipin isoform X1 n=1 Tax=Neodiprion pinetum TaxID=441929 RepID=UPI001EDE2058|nr:seipin isoform X1 [Neodiprion pinetum]
MVVLRLFRRLEERIFNVQQKTAEGVQTARDAVLRGGIIVMTAVVVIWISVFLYAAFYYAYMPNISHVRPVHLTFESCDEKKGICSFPSAHVQLTKKQQLLMVGQPYKVNLHLEMPESPTNRELGMFMVCAQLRDRDGVLVGNACRSAMLHYRSSLLHILTTLTFSPMMILGSAEEKQNIVLEMFANFEEDQSHPVTDVYVEIQSRFVEFYSATVMINAHLSGLRYIMFHWPILSAILGISTNLFFIALICVLSYLHFIAEDEILDDDFIFEKGEEEVDEEEDDDYKDEKSNTDLSSDTSSQGDTSMLEEIPKRKKEEGSSTAAATLRVEMIT